MNTSTSSDQTATFAALLQAAVTEPGKIHAAYFAFHGYSIGNRLLALIQCAERGITPGPIASFNAWKERGRFVQKGQRAIALWMPITSKRTIAQDGDESNRSRSRGFYSSGIGSFTLKLPARTTRLNRSPRGTDREH